MQKTKNIEFKSQNATLRGQMLLPENCEVNCPTVIMAHGFSTSIEMTANKYAAAFREAGYLVIIYDHYGLGKSEGLPRQDINYSIQARGFIDCLDFACSQAEVDPTRIALWGCSSSARLAYMVGSIDHRPKVILAQVPAFGADLGVEDSDNQAYNYTKKVVMSDDISQYKSDVTGPVRVVSRDQEAAPSYLYHPTAANWFLEYGNRPDAGWVNEVTVTRVDDPFGYHPLHSAKHLQSAVLLVVAHDEEIEGAAPAVVRQIFDSLEVPKKWVDIDGGHFGLLYYPSALFDKASQAEINFLNEHL